MRDPGTRTRLDPLECRRGRVAGDEGRALKHVQVREYVRSLVAGAAPGSPAPSERELVQRFGVARMTVRQAMDALVGEGLLERIPGRGTFVARPRRTASRLTSFTEEMARRGMLAESQTLLARREQAGPGVARALNVTRGRRGHPLAPTAPRRRAPMCVEDAYLNEVLIPGFLQSGMPTSLYDALAARGLRPTWAEDSINADVANRRGGRAASRSRPAPRCCGTRGAAWPARRSSRCRGRSTAPTASRCGCSSARRTRAHRAGRRRRRSPRRPTPGPGRRGPAGCTARAAGRRSPQSRQTGHRPTFSMRASCTSWATSPATYCAPSGHCSAHHLRCSTASSSAETATAVAWLRAARSARTRARASNSRVLSISPSCSWRPTLSPEHLASVAERGAPARRTPRPTVAAWATASSR